MSSIPAPPVAPHTATVPLHGGTSIPQLGLGVFQIPPEQVAEVVAGALALGYRHIDTAAAYVNETGVGEAVRGSGLPREQITVTSKLRNGDQGYDQALRAYEDTLARCGLDHLDLYLIHWPNPAAGLWQDSWRALQRLHREGAVGAIGVSNFLPEHLRELASFADELPAVNQIELHPLHSRGDLVALQHEMGIAVESYSPLGQGADLELPQVLEIAAAHDATPAQIVLRWHVQHGFIVIPKTTRPERMAENLDLGGLHLTDEEINAIDALDAARRIGNDPATFSLSQIR